ncbi:MAG: small subunit ribosomal protein [Blastocatellia bacterium]|jgi:small subunit ribosomal protein S17|nr:small subunit ribosomal protein [Blastocatellia bacterium]
MAEENQEEVKPTSGESEVVENTTAGETLAHELAPNVDSQAGNASATEAGKDRGKRSQKIGIVSSDKMQRTVVVRVDRLVLHPKYRRYVRRTSKFMAHNETDAAIGDKVRIVETRPLSARKRWRVVEIVQKAAK